MTMSGSHEVLCTKYPTPHPHMKEVLGEAMKRMLSVILVLVFGLSFAQNKELSVIGDYDNLLLLSNSPLRYFLDGRTNTLFIPEAALAPKVELPEGIDFQQKEEGLYLQFGGEYKVSLSPDEKRIQAVRVSQAPGQPKANAPVIVDADERAPLIYYLSNANPTQVAGTLTKLYSNLRIEVDERQRALLVLVNPADKALVEKLIKFLDAPRPQVFFEAEVVEINRNQTQTLGIDYDNLISFKFNEGTPPSNLLKLGEVSRGPISFSIALNFLQEQGAARVLAQPRVATLDGLEARINATQTTPLIVPGANGTQSVQNITTGVQMRMLPKVAPDGTIEVQVTISVSAPTGVTSQGAPQYASREATTTIRVRDGEPISIGGLIDNRMIEGVQKVPFLGDIPLLGELFTKRTTNVSNTDLVIVITPRLMTPLGP